jgi:hypothetical protein
MPRKTKADWARLIEAQIGSGLSAAEFCRRKRLDPRYFSLRKRRYRQLDVEPAPFVEARVLPKAMLPIKLRWRELELVLPPDCDASWLSSLMQGLSHEAG